MRIWIDMTASAHPLVFRPIIKRLREQGHEVEVTARDYAQTLELLDMLGIEHTSFGRHGGESRLGKVTALFTRARQMRKFAKGKQFDLAACHGSNDLPIAARRLGIPTVDMFDYEFATYQHNVGCRLSKRVMTPDSIPPERLRRYGVDDQKLAQYPGLKEEYYLADFEPNPAVLEQLGIDTEKVLVVLRPPPDVSLYHRKSNPLFPRVLERLGRDEGVHAVVLPRTQAQREFITGLELPSVIVPPGAVEAQSLIALADLVLSAGGTMNREAAALGTPVYTTYGGRLGGVDEALIKSGRLRPLTDPRALELSKRTAEATPTRRDPSFLVETILGTVGAQPLREEPHPVTPS
jgi:predicted glycosyltransferase